jgi:hypothetical protein
MDPDSLHADCYDYTCKQAVARPGVSEWEQVMASTYSASL